MKPRLLVSVAFLASVGVSGCDYRHEKGDVQYSRDAESWYETVRERVFVPSCISCHGSSGGVNLESYEAIKSNLARINQTAIVAKTMPLGGHLDPDALALLAEWIRAGAPIDRPPGPQPSSTPSPTPSSSPSPSPDPLKATFASIKSHIFLPRCKGCHNPTGEGKNVPLDKLIDLIESPRDLVLPGDSEESGLLIAVSRQDSKQMPPPTSGESRLTNQEIDVIQKWIDAGASEDDSSGPVTTVDVTKLSYALVNANVLSPRCVACHSGSEQTNLETYESVRANLQGILESTIVSQTMPTDRPLSYNQFKLLQAWIKAGAPKDPAPTPTPSPSPSPSPSPTPSRSPSPSV